MPKMIRSLIRILGGGRLGYVMLFFSYLVVTIFEIVGISVIPIFVAALASPEMISSRLESFSVFVDLSNKTPEDIIVVVGVTIAVFSIIKTMVLSFIGYFQARFIADRQSDLSSRLFSSYLYRPYLFHLERNSAELLRNTTGVAFSLFSGVVIPACTLATELLITLAVVLLLLLVNPIPTVVAVLFLGGFIILFYQGFKTKIGQLGAAQQKHATEMIKWVNQGFGGVKEIKVLGREGFFINAFNNHIGEYSRANTYLSIINYLPRYFVESLAMVGIILVVLVMVKQGTTIQSVLPALSLFGAAAMRLIPSSNRILNSMTTIRYNKSTIDIVGRELEGFDDIPSRRTVGLEARLPVKDVIRLQEVTFSYPMAKKSALEGVTFDIQKGTMVALVGQSGAGKTTLADIILGLCLPSSGRVMIDDKDMLSSVSEWQRNIGYVPQNIYMSDDSIRKNVAFGLTDSEIDDQKVRLALTRAQLMEFVDGLPGGINAEIGEHGSKLSGGQRQRIGIARALYHDPEVLVMDEATSALDNRTEREISAVLQGLLGQKTIIVIAHRLSTIKKCQKLFLFQEGRLLASGTYENLALNNAQFQSLTDIRRDE